MKNNLLIVCFASLSLVACAQKNTKKSSTPEAVKQAFATAHPDVKNARWEKEDANYEVGFTVDKKEQSILYNAEGTVLETEVEISMTELPIVIQELIVKDYPKGRIKETAKITDAKGNVSYEVEMNGTDLLFDNAGNKIH